MKKDSSPAAKLAAKENRNARAISRETIDGISRRRFLSTSVVGGAALLTGGLTSFLPTGAAAKVSDSLFVEANILELPHGRIF
jgi:hypothetical protein